MGTLYALNYTFYDWVVGSDKTSQFLNEFCGPVVVKTFNKNWRATTSCQMIYVSIADLPMQAHKNNPTVPPWMDRNTVELQPNVVCR